MTNNCGSHDAKNSPIVPLIHYGQPSFFREKPQSICVWCKLRLFVLSSRLAFGFSWRRARFQLWSRRWVRGFGFSAKRGVVAGSGFGVLFLARFSPRFSPLRRLMGEGRLSLVMLLEWDFGVKSPILASACVRRLRYHSWHSLLVTLVWRCAAVDF